MWGRDSKVLITNGQPSREGLPARKTSGVIDWDHVKRVYVRLPNWVGDVVLATPFLSALRKGAPNAQILAHGKGFQLKILEGEGHFDQTLTLQKGSPWWPFSEGRRFREAWGVPDVAFVLPNSFSAALVAKCTGAAVRVGYSLNGRGPLLTHGIPVRKEGLFRPIPMVDYYLGLLTRVGLPIDSTPRLPVLSTSDEAKDWAERFLTRHQMNAESTRVWAINIGGSWKTKRWIPLYAGRLVKLLRRKGISPLLLRGPDEAALADEVCDAAGERVPGADEVVGLSELTAVLSRCDVLITTDSGPRHFGIAAGIPVVCLIGSTHPGYTDVDYEGLELLCQRVSCWPCHLKVCPVDFKCMKALTPEYVLEGVSRHLGLELRPQIKIRAT
jgi:heptosyltransferase II